MKKINISGLILPDKTSHLSRQRMYQVYLGNGVREYFVNKKVALKFLADTNRFLNFKLHEINHLFINVFAEYRRHWFYFSLEDQVRIRDMKKKEQEIESMIQDISRLFNKAVRRHVPEGNFWAFRHMFSILEDLRSIIGILQEINRVRKYQAEFHRLEIFKGNAVRIQESLNNYAAEEQTVMPEKELHPDIFILDEI